MNNTQREDSTQFNVPLTYKCIPVHPRKISKHRIIQFFEISMQEIKLKIIYTMIIFHYTCSARRADYIIRAWHAYIGVSHAYIRVSLKHTYASLVQTYARLSCLMAAREARYCPACCSLTSRICSCLLRRQVKRPT